MILAKKLDNGPLASVNAETNNNKTSARPLGQMRWEQSPPVKPEKQSQTLEMGSNKQLSTEGKRRISTKNEAIHPGRILKLT